MFIHVQAATYTSTVQQICFYSLQGKCMKQVQDVIERLWDFIEKLNINTFGEFCVAWDGCYSNNTLHEEQWSELYFVFFLRKILG